MAVTRTSPQEEPLPRSVRRALDAMQGMSRTAGG